MPSRPNHESKNEPVGSSRSWRRPRQKRETKILSALRETKGFKSTISKIAHNTFNTGQSRFAAQFTQSRKNVANYLQRTVASEGYLVAETVRTGRKQVINLPSAINPNDPELEDKKII